MTTPAGATTFRSTRPGDPDLLADRHAVVDALYTFQTMLDTKDWAGIRAAMQEDVQGYGVAGIDEVVTIVRAHLDVCGATQHLMGNVQVRLDGDRATSRSYFRAFHVGSGANTGRTYECLGHYDDAWIRSGDRWSLAGRVINVRAELGDRAVIEPR
ncbi:nuclear transport factor 2 family protein [Rhodococcus sp. D2-41]|uniref:Nuclear transport factor 2 family protein n=1 Tax=Speluncibacter jeojiensis TaxID=2710754 RepID=A0A9X4M273_9ACTN|nr:nuclear transport factor 2 family protein [Rhodococcus sp. D2-41]MDG3008971.1 nuclear transport factor 2 family protein [Rhodococcus sp. D2-41]MDG3015482.1 nuclear transport factor 2 family protein [Corynebacteriales bacterium D3-21]